MLTNRQLDELQAHLTLATPAPWKFTNTELDGGMKLDAVVNLIDCGQGLIEEDVIVLYPGNNGDEDAIVAVEAVNALQSLIDEVRQSRKNQQNQESNRTLTDISTMV